MTLTHAYRAIVPFLMFVLVACGSSGNAELAAASTTATTVAAPAAPTTAPPVEAPTVETVSEPTAAPVVEATTEPSTAPTEVPVAETPTAPAAENTGLSFTPATYTDEGAGIEFDYPADWTLDPSSQVGVRGSQALLLSPGTTMETLADGGTRVSVVTYIWDPKNDLDAYIAQRKVAWEASGFDVMREEPLQLADGRAAYAFVVATPDQPTFMLFTTVGEDYLQIAGDGDAALVEEIARTLRPIN